MSDAVVDVRDLRIELTGSGTDVVDEIELIIHAGEVLGLVGESGSGKTTVGMALLGHTRRGGRVSGGDVRIDERELGALSQGELRRLRGGTVSYIPQDPGTSLNPALRIGTQLAEILDAHAADWGLMMNENRLSITVQPWSVLLPILAIGLLTVGTNLVTDGIARAAIGLDRRSES